MPAAPTTDGATGTDTTTGTDGTTDSGGTSDGSSTLGFEGSLTGQVTTSVSSSDSAGSDVQNARLRPLITPRSAQTIRTAGAGATVWFTTIGGDPLYDAQGNPYAPIPLGADNTFEMTGLPVGVDFVVNVDFDGDGVVDLKHIVTIPQDADGEGGSVTGVDVNPLTTMAVAKLISVIEAKGASADDLDFSPAAVINQLLDAFSSLFALMGIESTITIDQILSQTLDSLAAAFDALVPDSVKTSLDMATSTIDLSGAQSAEELVLAVIPVLLRAGIAIADEPGGVILDGLADLPNIKVVTWEELFGPMSTGFTDEKPQPAGATLPPEENRIFISTVVEVDRNFAMQQDELTGHGPGFIIRKHALERMAGLQFDGKTLSLGNVHTLATDLSIGMGMRLGYNTPMPPPDPNGTFDQNAHFTMTFQSADQYGVVVDVFALEEEINQIWNSGGTSPDEEDAKEAAVRNAVAAALANTQAPSLAQLFGGIVSTEDFVTIDGLSSRIRNTRSHIPFNWSGPQKWWVLADRDKWQHTGAKAVTVNIAHNADGTLQNVTVVADGTGAFYVNIWGDPEFGFTAEFTVVTTGRTLFHKDGFPFWANPADTSVFGSVVHPISGQTVSFIEAFSETGVNWPIEPAVEVSNPWFDPTLDPDPDTNPTTITLFVLVDQPGPEGVAVYFSISDAGVITADTDGNFVLEMYWEADVWSGGPVNWRTGQPVKVDPNADDSPVLKVPMDQIVGLNGPDVFTFLFDIEVPNPMYDPEGDPWYDDVNRNDHWDAGEPTFDWREELWQAGDWRSTNVERYYRRADNDQAVQERDVNWDASTPKTWTGVDLVPRNFKRRLNAFAFGRPNSAINLLTAFLGHDFFDGAHKLHAETRIGAFGALAMMNLVFDARLYNLEAWVVEYDYNGVRPAVLQVVEAWPWNPPIDDPIELVIDGLEDLASDQ